MQREDCLRRDIAEVLNRYSQENGSDTPDFILAEYLLGCLNNFDLAVQEREKWYGREPKFAQHEIVVQLDGVPSVPPTAGV